MKIMVERDWTAPFTPAPDRDFIYTLLIHDFRLRRLSTVLNVRLAFFIYAFRG